MNFHPRPLTALATARGLRAGACTLLLAASAFACSQHGERGWTRVTVAEAGSPSASDYANLPQVDVQLPDDSDAKLAVSMLGKPKALLFPESNTLADSRTRALEVGAALNQDDTLSLPLTSEGGTRLDVLIQPDGSALVPASKKVQR